jgi:hypothetical protein
LFAFLALGIALLAYFKLVKETVAGLALVAIVGLDLWGVDQRYLNDKKQRSEYEAYVKTDDKLIPYKPGASDLAILAEEEAKAPQASALKNDLLTKMKESPAYAPVKNKELLGQVAAFGGLNLSTNYRVLNLANPFNDAATSYYHKSIGGYHGAKLKNYQEIIEFHLQDELGMIIDSLKKQNPLAGLANADVINMLNAQYVVYNPDAPPVANPFALGNAWFVDSLVTAASADEEIIEVGEIDPANTAVYSSAFQSVLEGPLNADSTSVVRLEEYAPNLLKYESSSPGEGVVVFSEIYYPEGWVCRIDGKEVATARVNYILRAARVPAGDHTIEWSFEPQVWRTGNKVSMAGSVLLFVLLGGVAFSEYSRRKKAGADSSR